MEDTSIWSVTTNNNESKSSRNFNTSKKLRRKTIASSEPSRSFIDLSDAKTPAQFSKGPAEILLDEDIFIDACTPSTAKALTLPPTKDVGPLKSVVAYVEVFSDNENRTRHFADELRNFGASVCQRFAGPKVTHVLFRQGRQSTLLRAWSKKIPVVSVLWLDSCIKRNEKVPEAEFLITPENAGLFGKTKKGRYMQPETFNADVVLSNERIRKRVKRIESRRLMKEITNWKIDQNIVTPKNTNNSQKSTSKIADDDTTAALPDILALETPLVNGEFTTNNTTNFASHLLASNNKWLSMAPTCTPESLRRQMDEIKKKLASLMDSPTGSESQESESLSQTVRKKLLELYGNAAASTPVIDSSVIDVTPCTSRQAAARRSVEAKKSASSRRESFAATEPRGDIVVENTVPLCAPDSARRSVRVTRRSLFDFGFRMTPPLAANQIDDAVVKSTKQISPPKTPKNRMTSLQLLSANRNKLGESKKLQLSSSPVRKVFAQVKSTARRRTMAVICESRASSDSDELPLSNLVIVKKPKRNYVRKSTSVAVNTIKESPEANFSEDIASSSKEQSKITANKTSQSLYLNVTSSTKDSLSLDTEKIDNLINKVIGRVSDELIESKTTINYDIIVSNKKNTNKRFMFVDKSESIMKNSPVLLKRSQKSVNEPEKIILGRKDDVDLPDSSSETLYKLNPKKPKTRLRSSFFELKVRSSDVACLQRGRTSSQEFISKNEAPKNPVVKKNGSTKNKTPTTPRKIVATKVKLTTRRLTGADANGIVLTSVDSKKYLLAKKAVRKLGGGFFVEKSVTEKTTHVVCGQQRRTLNVLYGLARNCWILSIDWVSKSLKKGRWLEEEAFLSATFNKKCINVENPLVTTFLLQNCGPIYVSKNCKPPSHDIEALIKILGGKVTKSLTRCKLSIGEINGEMGVVSVVEPWLLDSITEQRLMPFDDYYF